MKSHIFFREGEIFQNEIRLHAEEIEHLKSLRILQIDKELEFRDGKGNSFFFKFQAGSKNGIFQMKETIEKIDRPIEIAVAIPKSDRLDYLIQKGTEIGVTKFIFINFLQSERKSFNEDRCKKIISEAASQSKRHFLPLAEIQKNLGELVKSGKNYFYLNPRSKKSIGELADWNFIPIIGPEGGFRDEEILFFENNGIEGYSLGENILRIETAFIFIASIKKFQLDLLKNPKELN